ncbi:transcription antitermination factor NusB [Chloroflexota bacterium]
MTGERHKARVLALQGLYEIDAATHDAGEVTSRLTSQSRLSAESRAFGATLIEGVILSRDKIDQRITEFAPAWPISQMPLIDRNILRVAIFEVLFDNRIPVRAAINEAVELAKSFGSENSPKFINGVLGSISSLAQR